jgi:CBS domain-containing protein
VVDEADKPVGILSERDIVRAMVGRDDVLALTIGQVMTTPVIAATPQDDLTSVMQTMTERRFRHLPIVDRGKLAGIVSIGDVVKAQLDAYRGEIDTLQMQIIGGES